LFCFRFLLTVRVGWPAKQRKKVEVDKTIVQPIGNATGR